MPECSRAEVRQSRTKVLILSMRRCRGQKLMEPVEFKWDISWSRPRKSPWLDMGWCFSTAKGVPRISLRCINCHLRRSFGAGPVHHICVIEVHGNQTSKKAAPQCFHKLGVAIETCHCQREPEEQGVVKLESRLLPLIMPPSNNTAKTLLPGDWTVSISIWPVLASTLKVVMSHVMIPVTLGHPARDCCNVLGWSKCTAQYQLVEV